MNPCKYCKPPKRRVGCHSVCPEYKDWTAEELERKKKISEKKKSEYTHKRMYQKRKLGMK